MATARAHTRIARPPEEVWQVVADPTGITKWFPSIAACTLEGDVRHVTTTNGIEVDERVVTNDAALRRFQYSIVPGPVPVESHLNTIDVLDDPGGSLVVYSCDVSPDALKAAMQQSIDGAVAALKQYVEG
jgi:hypothetical protein